MMRDHVRDMSAALLFPYRGASSKMEDTLVLASIAQRFRLSLVLGQTIVPEPEPEPEMTLRPKKGMLMRVVKC